LYLFKKNKHRSLVYAYLMINKCEHNGTLEVWLDMYLSFNVMLYFHVNLY